MLDGPFCFQTLPDPDLPYTEQEALFISEEEYLAVKQVPNELTAATKFLQVADKKELWWNEVKKAKPKIMTAYYMLRFDEIWMQKMPNSSQKDY